MSLERIRYDTGAMEYESSHLNEPESALAGYLEKAKAIIERAAAESGNERLEPPPLPEAFERLRWFPLPHEAQAELQGRHPQPPAGGLLHA